MWIASWWLWSEHYFSRTFSHITSRTVAARVADCKRSSLSLWELHWLILKHGLRLE
jgi:hypothetical protein